MKRKIPILPIDYDTYLDLHNIASGAFAPLSGFLCSGDYHGVVEEMHLSCGSPWTIPITIDVPEERCREFIDDKKLLLYFQNNIAATMYPEDLFKVNYERDIIKLFGTRDTKHPGVRKEISRSPFRLGGKIVLFGKMQKYMKEEYELTPKETKEIFAQRRWKTIAGFQTRNPIHRAHEYLQRITLEIVDGLFIQPLLGWKKAGDFSPKAVVMSYQKMMDEFYPKERVVFGALNTAMRYAGPREAVFHAVIRKNFGCTHFIVGRDHAGVGSYYGKYDAHKLCSEFPNLGIEIIKLHGPFYCEKCENIVTERTCSHAKSGIIDISGTEIRKMIADVRMPAKECMREEIAAVLLDLSRAGEAFCE